MSEATEADTAATNAALVESVRNALDGLRESAHVGRAYGDPMTLDGKTIVPVARVAYGFGAGFGTDTDSEGEATTEGESGGAGGGGGVVTQPVGVLEITDDGTRFVRFGDWKRLALATGVGVVLGLLLGRR
jgi:uncharacterized spore protein YtfJ